MGGSKGAFSKAAILSEGKIVPQSLGAIFSSHLLVGENNVTPLNEGN